MRTDPLLSRSEIEDLPLSQQLSVGGNAVRHCLGQVARDLLRASVNFRWLILRCWQFLKIVPIYFYRSLPNRAQEQLEKERKT